MATSAAPAPPTETSPQINHRRNPIHIPRPIRPIRPILSYSLAVARPPYQARLFRLDLVVVQALISML